MLHVRKLDDYLLDIAWSLWTELGVLGHERRHKDCLIALEELVLLTSILAEVDPRLRDESLDWCSLYHHFFSISRLKSIIKEFEDSVKESFSKYSVTLNAISRSNWPVFKEFLPRQFQLSRKSSLRPIESPSLLNIRARSLFGTGARADVVTFFLLHEDKDFSVSDTVETGYSKRNLAEILEELTLSGLLKKSSVRNQQRYRLAKRDHLMKILSPVPRNTPPWQTIIKVILPLRECLKRIEKLSESTQLVEIRNLLETLDKELTKLNLNPPSFSGDISKYLHSFDEWLINFVRQMSQGDFSNIQTD